MLCSGTIYCDQAKVITELVTQDVLFWKAGNGVSCQTHWMPFIPSSASKFAHLFSVGFVYSPTSTGLSFLWRASPKLVTQSFSPKPQQSQARITDLFGISCVAYILFQCLTNGFMNTETNLGGHVHCHRKCELWSIMEKFHWLVLDQHDRRILFKVSEIFIFW